MAKNALYELSRSAERMLQTSKKAMLPSFWPYGIQSLPDEILSQIFRLASDSHHDDRPAVLSRVCRHFRRVALRDPLLWSLITSHMFESRILSQLDRSQSVGLTVIIHEERWSDSLKNFVRLATSYASRWKSFHFKVPSGLNPKSLDKVLEMYLGNLYLPMLEEFELDDRNTDGEIAFYETWKAPRLHKAALLGHPFLSDFDMPSLTSITSFRFTESYEPSSPVLLIPESITRLPNLVDLDLCICVSPTVTLLDRTSIIRCVVPRLRHFRFKVSAPNAFWTMMRFLQAPALESCSLNIVDSRRELSPSRWLDGCDLVFPSAKELNFEFLGKEEPIYLNRLYELFPGTERLRVVAHGSRICDGGVHTVKIPPLISLTIRTDSHVDELFDEFYEHLQHDKRWDGFKRLQVCAESMQRVAKHSLEGKLVWIDRAG